MLPRSRQTGLSCGPATPLFVSTSDKRTGNLPAVRGAQSRYGGGGQPRAIGGLRIL